MKIIKQFKKHHNQFKTTAICIILLLFAAAFVTAQNRPLTIETEPNAAVWMDNIKFGTTDTTGKLTIRNLPAGKHSLRVRLNGFKEVSQNLLPAQKGTVKIALVKTNDEAELAFQQAETSADREKAAELYEKAVKLRPKYAEAYVGLARVLSGSGDFDGALSAIGKARKIRLAYAEASAVEGRIYKDNGNTEKAIASFKRALVEGKGVQPEAEAGLGLLYVERAEDLASKGDFEGEAANYVEAAKYLQAAVKQLSGAPDSELIYQKLGQIYEKTNKDEQAIKIYEEFLRTFPDSDEAEAVRSFITQLKKKISGQ